jgi:hypothetical protein
MQAGPLAAMATQPGERRPGANAAFRNFPYRARKGTLFSALKRRSLDIVKRRSMRSASLVLFF